MLSVQNYLAIRLAYQNHESKRSIARRLHHSQKTVAKVIASQTGQPPPYQRSRPAVYPKLGPFLARIDAILAADESAPRTQSHTAVRIFQRLRDEHGYAGKHDQVRVREHQQRSIREQLADIERMQQRLLDGYLAGGLDKDVFTAKSTEFKIEADRLRERLADAAGPSGVLGRRVKEAFEFSQNAADQWTVSGVTDRRAILTRTLLKRCLSATSLVTKKRRPFDALTEGPILDESRGCGI